LRTLPAGSQPPVWVAFTSPDGPLKNAEAADVLTLAVAENTRQAMADALALDVATVAKPLADFAGYQVQSGSYVLTATLWLPDTEKVYWGQSGTLPTASDTGTGSGTTTSHASTAP
jgi:hypothetical protein